MTSKRDSTLIATTYQLGCEKSLSVTFTFGAQRRAEAPKGRPNISFHVDETGARLTFAEIADEWLDLRESIDVKQRTVSHNRSMLAHAIEVFGDYHVAEINAPRLQSLLTALAATHSSSTVTHVRRVVRQVLDDAQESGAISINVAARKMHVPKESRKNPVLLSPDQIVRLADEAPDYRAIILLAGMTGLRYSEIAGLRVRSFDRLKRTIRVEHQLDRDTGELAPLKTEQSRRTLKLPEQIVFLLARLISEHVDESDPDAFLFTGPEGQPLRYGNFMKRVWKPAVAKLDDVPDDLGFHDLRHSHAAHLIEQGEHAKPIQSRLGHVSIKTTLDRYGHLMEGMDESAASKIDEAFAI